jgi:hypothetical protein
MVVRESASFTGMGPPCKVVGVIALRNRGPQLGYRGAICVSETITSRFAPKPYRA